MALLTSLILAVFAAYVGSWYFGAVEGNFALLLFLATVVTGLYWLAERLYFLLGEAQPHPSLEAARALTDAFVARWRFLWAEHGDHAFVESVADELVGA